MNAAPSVIRRRIGEPVRVLSRWGYLTVKFNTRWLDGHVFEPDEARLLAVELVRHADRLNPPKVPA